MRLLLLPLLLCASLLAEAPPDPSPLGFTLPVKEKNFYLLARMEQDRSVAGVLAAHPALREMGERKRRNLREALQKCESDLACHVAAFRWTPEEIVTAGGALREVYRASPLLQRFVDDALRRSGVFHRYRDKTGEELLVQAWTDAAQGMERIVDRYGEGKAPRYPAIDAAAYDVKSDTYRRLVHIAVTVLDELAPPQAPFFDLPLRFSLALLEINRRDEAGRFEPLEEGENRAAYRSVSSMDWRRYPYTVIVVPGAGSDRPGLPLSPWGKMRLALAAKRYREGKAPFILVSGGFVHPNQTPYCEALEMKKSLMADFGIPESAILIDPHARHTTTNLRNAVRILYRYGIPAGRKALITTDLYQSRYIEAPSFNERCLKEMSLIPHRIVGRISPADLEFLPQLDALHADAVDPLDP